MEAAYVICRNATVAALARLISGSTNTPHMPTTNGIAPPYARTLAAVGILSSLLLVVVVCTSAVGEAVVVVVVVADVDVDGFACLVLSVSSLLVEVSGLLEKVATTSAFEYRRGMLCVVNSGGVLVAGRVVVP
jgi:hypothetical protein